MGVFTFTTTSDRGLRRELRRTYGDPEYRIEK
jgi:hypothetical protein